MRVKYKLEILGRHLIYGKDRLKTAGKIADILYRKLILKTNRPRNAAYGKNLKKFRNIHAGKRCFIIGNGPSLNKTDLSLLNNEYTFGVNGIFYKYDDVLFRPTYYVVEDNHVVADNLKRINEIDYSIKVFPVQYSDLIDWSDDTFFFGLDIDFYQGKSPHFETPRFSKDASEVVYAGQTVTYVNLQLAFYLGFKEVYLVGVDFSYKIPESAKIEGLTIISQDDDPNHFHPDYFGKGKKWHDPKLENCLKSYRFAKKLFEDDGRKIYNATVGGRLEVYERVDYYSLFGRKPILNRPNNIEQYTISECLREVERTLDGKRPVIIEMGGALEEGEGESTAQFVEFAGSKRPKGIVYAIGGEKDRADDRRKRLEGEYRLDTSVVKFTGDGPKQLISIFDAEKGFDLALIKGVDLGKNGPELIKTLIANRRPSSLIVVSGRVDGKSISDPAGLIPILKLLAGTGMSIWVNRRIIIASERLSLPMMDRLSNDYLSSGEKVSDVSPGRLIKRVKRGEKGHRAYRIGCPPSFNRTVNTSIRLLAERDVPFLISKGSLFIYY